MRMCNAGSQKRSAKGSNFNEDDRPLPFLRSYFSLKHPSEHTFLCFFIKGLLLQNVTNTILKHVNQDQGLGYPSSKKGIQHSRETVPLKVFRIFFP